MQLWRRLTARQRKLPDFLIIGAQRSGTSSLYQHLARHPNVKRAARKEVHFFDTHFHRGLDWYRAQFPFSGVTGEASPSYLFLPHVPERVKQALPTVKLIAILRNPIDRALSSYHHQTRKKRESRPFAEAIQFENWPVARERFHHAYLARGLYADQLEHWLKFFPKEQLLVLSAEKFFKEPSLDRVCAFLGIPAWSGDPTVQRWVKEKYSYGKYQDMDDALRQKLADYFRPHNERLYRLVGENFGWES